MQSDLSKAEPPKRQRRWYQFSLRSLMIFTAVVAVLFGWLGSKIGRKRNQQQIVDTFSQYGANIRFDYQQPSGTLGSGSYGASSTETAYGPAWLRSLLGENFFSEVIDVNFIGSSNVVHGRGGKVTDEILSRLNSLPEVESLILLLAPNITDAGFANITQLKKLNYLCVSGTQITETGLVSLRDLPCLEHLFLSANRISDSGLENLKGLSTLHELGLDEDAVTDAGLKTLESLTSLQYLMIGCPRITDAGLEHLKGLKQLKKLSLNRTKVTDEGVARLQKALPNCKISY